MTRRGLVLVLAITAPSITTLAGCTPVVRYTDELVDERFGRTWFTRLPATVGGTAGFVVGLPVDLIVLPATFVVYRTQPAETRDPLSVFLFPSFVLWKVGTLFGAPFDLVEWAAYRAWVAPKPLTQQEREAIEREWDAREYYSEYPATPIHPREPAMPALPATAQPQKSP